MSISSPMRVAQAATAEAPETPVLVVHNTFLTTMPRTIKRQVKVPKSTGCRSTGKGSAYINPRSREADWELLSHSSTGNSAPPQTNSQGAPNATGHGSLLTVPEAAEGLLSAPPA